MINVRLFGAVGDGTTDDFAAIEGAVAALGSSSNWLYFPPGCYKVSQAVLLQGLGGVTVCGPGATILFPSSDTGLAGDPSYDNDPANMRSGFYLRDCEDIAFEDIWFRGDREALFSEGNGNIGYAVAGFHTCRRVRLNRVRQHYGAGLVSLLAGSAGAVVQSCYSYGSRGNSRVGDNGVFRDTTFELPFNDNQFDSGTAGPGGVTGSSHAIYLFGSSGNRVLVDGCSFLNIRQDGVKMSGSSLALSGLNVVNSRFYNCGYQHDGTNSSGSCILFGADDNQIHTVVGIENNQFFDCQSWITVVGAQNVKILGNQGHRTTIPASIANTLIQVTRYVPTSQPIADVLIEGNTASSQVMTNQPFTVDDMTDVVTTRNSSNVAQPTGWPTGFGPIQAATTDALPGGLAALTDYYWISVNAKGAGKLATSRSNALANTAIDITSAGSGTHTFTVNELYAVCGIDVRFVGDDLPARTSPAVVVNNVMGQGLGTDIQVTGGSNPVLRGNIGDAGLTVTGSRMPRIIEHTINDPKTSNAVIRPHEVSWPIINGNLASNRLSGTLRGSASTGDNAGGSTPVRFPLSGLFGRVVCSESRPEVVFAYGYDWTNGDTLIVNGTTTSTLTFGTDFSDFDSLVQKLNEGTDFEAYDYGAPWDITTYHIRLRWATTSTTPNLFSVESKCRNKTAGVVLTNGGGSSPTICSSKGEGANKVVIWSPCIRINEVPVLTAENADAAAAIALGAPYPVSADSALEETCCVVMQLGAGEIDSAASFQWRLA
jgi:hypothetical protein